MKFKRITVLSDVSYPDTNAGASRIYERLKYWAPHFEGVNLVTQKPSNQAPDLRKLPSNVKVKRLPRSPISGNFLPLRAISYLWFSQISFWSLLFSVKKHEVLFVTSPQFLNLIVAYMVSKLKGASLVFEISDLWPDTLVDLGLIRPAGILYKVWQKIEVFLYERADLIVALTPGIADKIKKKTSKKLKVSVAINGFETSFWKFQEEPVKDPFVIGYYGTLGRVINVEMFLDVAAAYSRAYPDQSVAFHLAGQGVKDRVINKFIEENPNVNLKFFGELPKEKMQEKWAETSICLIPLQDMELMEVCIPAKLLECIGVGVPVILSSRESDASRIIKSYGFGALVSPSDVTSCAELIHQWKSTPEKVEKIKAKMKMCRDEFSREKQASKILDFMSNI